MSEFYRLWVNNYGIIMSEGIWRGGGDLSGEFGECRRLSLDLKIIVTFAIFLHVRA